MSVQPPCGAGGPSLTPSEGVVTVSGLFCSAQNEHCSWFIREVLTRRKLPRKDSDHADGHGEAWDCGDRRPFVRLGCPLASACRTGQISVDWASLCELSCKLFGARLSSILSCFGTLLGSLARNARRSSDNRNVERDLCVPLHTPHTRR